MIYNFLFPTKPNTTKVSLFFIGSPHHFRNIINEPRYTEMEQFPGVIHGFS